MLPNHLSAIYFRSSCLVLFLYFAFNFYRGKSSTLPTCLAITGWMKTSSPPPCHIHSQQTLFGEGSLRVNFSVPFRSPFTYIKFRSYAHDAQLLLLITRNSTISPENHRRCLTDIKSRVLLMFLLINQIKSVLKNKSPVFTLNETLFPLTGPRQRF